MDATVLAALAGVIVGWGKFSEHDVRSCDRMKSLKEWIHGVVISDNICFVTCVLAVSRVLLPTVDRCPINSNHLRCSLLSYIGGKSVSRIVGIYRNINPSILVCIGEPECMVQLPFSWTTKTSDKNKILILACLLEGHVVNWFNLVIVQGAHSPAMDNHLTVYIRILCLMLGGQSLLIQSLYIKDDPPS